tara:strand:+ start:501 stop:689 length:189 start_codon:yes stop_codon:yes gene_type:complete
MATVKDTIVKLAAHEKECIIRYENIEKRLESGAKKFDRLELIMFSMYPFIISAIALFKWMPA